MLGTNLRKQKVEDKIEQQRKSDLVLNKLMLFFVVGVIGIFGMLAVERNLRTIARFRTSVLPALTVIAGIAFVAALVYFALQRSRHVDESRKILTSWNLLGTATVFFWSCLYYEFAFDATQVVITMICCVVLYFVYHIFRKDFFMCSVITAAQLVLLKIATISTATTVGMILAATAMAFSIIVPIIGFLAVVLLHINKGTLTIGTAKLALIEKGDKLYPTITVSAISLIGAILTIITPAAAIYSIIVLLAVYLAIAVAYTIRMM